VRGHPPHEVLLGFKKIGFGAGKYAGFGGAVEDGETIPVAAARELAEETSIQVAEHDLHPVGHLTFLFPANPAWNQLVHVFRVTTWQGAPVESREMKPVWFSVDHLPYHRMWQDAPHWLPTVLAGKRIQLRIVFADDNETVHEIYDEM
jgi:8-oxo-dGTP pyrophosphatase MutT (NUDIX family)